MGILSTLKAERAGEWKSLADYLRELRHRESGALGALAAALSAPPAEQKELAEQEDAPHILLDVACDLRVPKGGRLAAARCLLEGGIEAPYIGQLFIGAGDLVTDPRLGATARRLVEGGLPSAVQIGGEAALVTLAAGSFARAVQASASAVGQARAKELLAGAHAGHAGAAAGLFALGQGELPADHLEQWKTLLQETCEKNRRAPAAAKRMGLAPPWPPNLPDAFAPLVKEAEEASKDVTAADAAANPAALKKKPPVGAVVAPGRPVTVPPKGEPPPKAAPPEKPKGDSFVVDPKAVGPAIKRSAFRRPTGSVQELSGKVTLPPKPMQEVKGRITPSVEPPPDTRPRVEPKEEGVVHKPSPLQGIAAPPPGSVELRFDSRGKRIPRSDRWDGDHWEWQQPALPSPDLPPPRKLGAAPGPFTQRIKSLFDDRPEAVDRLCAAAEARAAIQGNERMLAELGAELRRKGWRGRRPPPEQRARLQAVAADARQPGSWRSVAQFLLEKFAVLETAADGSG
ncbi:MAG TPA: hypothetical protein VLW85_19500 [Myxococcales bacterium]|nr:hypothetical protein [Myxococcales bacterium]